MIPAHLATATLPGPNPPGLLRVDHLPLYVLGGEMGPVSLPSTLAMRGIWGSVDPCATLAAVRGDQPARIALTLDGADALLAGGAPAGALLLRGESAAPIDLAGPQPARLALRDQDLLLLAAGDLLDRLHPAAIATIVSREASLDEAAASVVEAWREAGGQDGALLLLAWETVRPAQPDPQLLAGLRKNRLFAELSDRELRQLVPSLGQLRVPTGGAFIRESDEADSIFLILEGAARVTRGSTFLVDVGPGDHLGELSVVAPHRRTAAAVALSPLWLATLSRQDLGRLLRTHPALAARVHVALLRNVGDRLRDLTNRLNAESADLTSILTRTYLERARSAALTAPVATILLAMVASQDAPLGHCLAWLIIVTLADLATLLHTQLFLRRRPTVLAPWRRRQIALHAIAGLAWGSSGWLLTPWTGHNGFLELHVLWLVGVTAVSAASMSAYAITLLLFQIFAWLPTLLTLFGRATPLDFKVGLGILILSALEQQYAAVIRRQTTEAITNGLRFERSSADLTRAQMDLAGAHDRLQRQHGELQRAHARITELATRDPLTGLFNRRHLTEQVRLADPTALASLVFLDLDHFKRINDTRGHAAGDAVLIEVARRIQARLPPGALAGRWGGEELIAWLPGQDAAAAHAWAAALRAALADHPVDWPPTPIPITGSFGLAARAPGEPIEAWVERADQACYAAKRAGRDQVMVG